MVTYDSTKNTVNLLQGSTLTGKSARNGNSGLFVNIDNTSTWEVTDASTLSILKNGGVLDLSAAGASLIVQRVRAVTTIGGAFMTGDGSFTQLASGTTLMTLIGGGPTSAKVAVASGAVVPVTLAGTLDITLENPFDAVGQTFTLFAWGARPATQFDEFLLNGVDIWQYKTAWAFDDVLIDGLLVSGSVTYSGSALTLAITQAVIPEPGTWVLMLGGLGVLGYLQRARRKV